MEIDLEKLGIILLVFLAILVIFSEDYGIQSVITLSGRQHLADGGRGVRSGFSGGAEASHQRRVQGAALFYPRGIEEHRHRHYPQRHRGGLVPEKYTEFELILAYCISLCYNVPQRRSILVGSAGSQVGPKNPMKGISMKSLVSAFYAQFRVDAGG